MLYLFLFSAFVQVVKGHQNIFGKSGCKDVFGCSELMSWLAYDGINNIKSGNFVLGSALLDEFFHTLDNMLVIFDCADSPLSYGCHFSLGNGRLNLVQRRELKNKSTNEITWKICKFPKIIIQGVLCLHVFWDFGKTTV